MSIHAPETRRALSIKARAAPFGPTTGSGIGSGAPAHRASILNFGSPFVCWNSIEALACTAGNLITQKTEEDIFLTISLIDRAGVRAKARKKSSGGLISIL